MSCFDASSSSALQQKRAKERIALNHLCTVENVVALPADKGNVMVILDSNDYKDKMKDTLNGPAYMNSLHEILLEIVFFTI